MKELLIVDGSNLLFQMFFGMPARITGKDGRGIWGTLGFTGALIKIIKLTSPTHILVIFDGEHKNERTETDSEYKANRRDFSETPDEGNPFSQLFDIYSVLDFMGILHFETTDCETDDLIATYAKKYSGEYDIIISSQDSDFFQLVRENVRIFRYRGEKTVLCDTEYVRAKTGVLPSEYADFKCLTGDGSDNIKGIYGVGAKTAAELINTYKTLDGVVCNAGNIKKTSLREAVLCGRERLIKNKKLIKLTGNAEIPVKAEDAIFEDRGFSSGEVLSLTGLK